MCVLANPNTARLAGRDVAAQGEEVETIIEEEMTVLLCSPYNLSICAGQPQAARPAGADFLSCEKGASAAAHVPAVGPQAREAGTCPHGGRRHRGP